MAYDKRKSETTETNQSIKRVKTAHNKASSYQSQRSSKTSQDSADAENGKQPFLNGTSSREAHQKQKALRQERIAGKPNADPLLRSKKIWEKLRIKSSVPKEERKQLVDELFSIISGRVKDFVFKHDATRVIQCALKYATPDQKTQIAEELRGSYRELAESKYAKFLVAKLIVLDHKVRDLVVPEFYGHVKKLMRHPEASWIVDDIYRTMATKEQKARLLREWYGPEFVIFSKQKEEEAPTAELAQIIERNPGKKGPIMQHLKEMTNQLVQKKSSGFTMLHDALLQYFVNCTPGSPEHTEFLEMLRDDEDGDLFKNLAFTKSGARVVCLALAYGTSKDRRTILKHFKTHVRLMAADAYAHQVLLAAFEVIDDTVMTAKAIVPELTCKDLEKEAKENELFGLVTHKYGRIPLVYLFAESPPKWLLDSSDHEILQEIRGIRGTTSKKDPETRRQELVKATSPPLLEFISEQATTLVQSSFGCQFVGEVMIGADGDKGPAVLAIAELVKESETSDLLKTPHAGRLFKSLVQGGRFDTTTKEVVSAEPPLKFGDKLYEMLRDEERLLQWTTSENSWSIVAMLESQEFEHKSELLHFLQQNCKQVEDLSTGDGTTNAGTKTILDKINVTKSNGEADSSTRRESKRADGAEKKVKAKRKSK